MKLEPYKSGCKNRSSLGGNTGKIIPGTSTDDTALLTNVAIVEIGFVQPYGTFPSPDDDDDDGDRNTLQLIRR